MTIVLLILTLCLGVAFIFINKLIDRWETERHNVKYLEEKVKELRWEMDDIYTRHNNLRDFTDEVNAKVEQDKANIDACANAILKMRNDIGKIGNRVQKIERTDNE